MQHTLKKTSALHVFDTFFIKQCLKVTNFMYDIITCTLVIEPKLYLKTIDVNF